MRTVLALSAAFWLILPASAQEDPSADQRRVLELLRKLREKIEYIIVSKKETSPDYARRLEEALKKLKLDGPEIHADAVLRELKARRIENALIEGMNIEVILQAILALLEDPADFKTPQARLQRLIGLLGELRNLSRDEKKLRGDSGPAEDRAREQKHLAERTRELERKADDLNRPEAARSLGSARVHMGSAEHDLRHDQFPGDDQDKALEDLKQAERDLLDAIEETRRRVFEEQLLSLENDLKKAIERQERINLETLDLDTLRVRNGCLTRREQGQARVLGGAQEDLSKLIDELKKRLSEENFEVFKCVLDSVMDDMTESAARLNETDLGARTQEAQADALRKLKDLVEAFASKRRRMSAEASGRGDPQRSGVPDVVQLRLIRKMQEAIHQKTKTFLRRFDPSRADLAASDKEVLRRLSEGQGRLADILRRLIEKHDRRDP